MRAQKETHTCVQTSAASIILDLVDRQNPFRQLLRPQQRAFISFLVSQNRGGAQRRSHGGGSGGGGGGGETTTPNMSNWTLPHQGQGRAPISL